MLSGAVDGIEVAMQLEVWMDFGCPWCLLARTRLDRALAAFEMPATRRP